MKYLIEVDSDTDKGSQLIKYIEALEADDSAVHILHEPPLTDEEMVMPGKRPSNQRLEEWLKPQDEEMGHTISESRDYIRKRIEEMKKGEKK
jgi:hypothetical protein